VPDIRDEMMGGSSVEEHEAEPELDNGEHRTEAGHSQTEPEAEHGERGPRQVSVSRQELIRM